MNLGLAGKACVVTGSTDGIGLVVARALAVEGALVVTCGRRGAPGVGEALHVTADLSVAGEPERVVAEAAGALGRMDVLVNNVGVARQARFEEVPDEEWDAYWQLNVMSYVRAIRAALPHLRAAGGAIVNVSSTAGKRPSTGMPHYSVTKAAVLSLSRLVADLCGGDGIRCNAVTPGPVATDAWLGEGALADQVAGVNLLKSKPWVDGSRIGIWGWSYGGYMTCNAMLNAADVFKVGFAGAPVTDWRQYDTIYTERYMGLPKENEEGYKQSSPVTHAAKLRGKLLIAFGTGDDNVHFANTVELSEQFIKAGRYVEFQIYPGRGHGISDRPARVHLFNRVTQFFLDNL